MPIDLILGDQHVRQQLCAGTPVDALETAWQAELERFEDLRQRHLIYT